MKNKLQDIINRYNELTDLLTKQEIISNKDKFKEISKEHNSLIDIHQLSLQYLNKIKQLEENKELFELEDEELVEMAKNENIILKDEISNLEDDIKILLLPKDENDDKNIIIEIRGGTGGEEAALFASDL